MIDIKIEEILSLREKEMTYKEIVEYFKKQGKKISVSTVCKRLNEYYNSKKIENRITDEELVKKKEEGMTDKEIAEYFTNQGKRISAGTVNRRINEYYLSGEDEKPKNGITNKELAKKKEEGMTDKEIAEYFTNQGKKISAATVNTRLNEYYSSRGTVKPKINRKKKVTNQTDEYMARLSEEGLTYDEITKVLVIQNIKISRQRVSQRLARYYEVSGVKRRKIGIRLKSKNGITNEELLTKKEEKLTDKEIAEYFTKQGKAIDPQTVTRRLKAYYKYLGKKKPRGKTRKIKTVSRVGIKDEDLAKKKEEGMTDKQIAEYFTAQGKNTTISCVNKRLTRYYNLIGKVKPIIEKKGNKQPRSGITDEELVRKKEEGMSDERISQYFTIRGRKIKSGTVGKRLTEYYKSQGKDKPIVKRKSEVIMNDELLMDILIAGATIREGANGDKDKIEMLLDRLKRLKIIAENAKKDGDKFLPDEEFLEVIKRLEDIEGSDLENTFETLVSKYLTEGVSEKGNIDLIKNKVFEGNCDLMVYTLSKMDIIYQKQQDKKIWEGYKKSYIEKIDKYFGRLHSIEDSRKKNKNKTNSGNGSNLRMPGEER